MAVITAEQAGGQEVVRFLDLIAVSEGTALHKLTAGSGYDVIVTGIAGPDLTTDKPGLEIFTDFTEHPFTYRRAKLFRLPDTFNHRSTAAGRYQILYRWWKSYKPMLRLPDFSPLSQDLYAIQQLKERWAIALIQAGKVDEAIKACSPIWASFPGNTYGQGGHSMQTLLATYHEIGGSTNV